MARIKASQNVTQTTKKKKKDRRRIKAKKNVEKLKPKRPNSNAEHIFGREINRKSSNKFKRFLWLEFGVSVQYYCLEAITDPLLSHLIHKRNGPDHAATKWDTVTSKRI
eukprot:520208_1